MAQRPRKRIYCFVDETGQDTMGQFFIVVVVCVASPDEILSNCLIQTEKLSEKGVRKRVFFPTVRSYINAVFSNEQWKNNIYYQTHYNSINYDQLTVQTINESLQRHLSSVDDKQPKINVKVDGLNDYQELVYATILRRYGVSVENVKGIKDQGSPYIRLADSIARIIRRSIVGEEPYRYLLKRLIRKGSVHRL